MKKILILSLAILAGALTVSAANLSDNLISSAFTDFAGMQNPMNQFNLMNNNASDKKNITNSKIWNNKRKKKIKKSNFKTNISKRQRFRQQTKTLIL